MSKDEFFEYYQSKHMADSEFRLKLWFNEVMFGECFFKVYGDGEIEVIPYEEVYKIVEEE